MSWQSTLDAFAAALDDQSAALERGDIEGVQAFSPPAGLGPLPVELRPRAEELLGRAQGLTEELVVRKTATQREIALLAGLLPRRGSASYVDRSL